MTTEREKLEQGLWYDANFDAELLAERERAADLYFQFNQTPPSETAQREALLDRLLPKRGADVSVVAPFYTDYGYNCVIGEGTFFNVGCYLMDGARITIGSNCFIGPNCGFYTANHPLIASERNAGLEKAKPITLGDDVWLGGNVTVLPGVTIGNGSVIGAGSVVTKSIPEGVVAAGNPCRVIRPITEADRVFW